jgi:hypothetical protein
MRKCPMTRIAKHVEWLPYKSSFRFTAHSNFGEWTLYLCFPNCACMTIIAGFGCCHTWLPRVRLPAVSSGVSVGDSAASTKIYLSVS